MPDKNKTAAYTGQITDACRCRISLLLLLLLGLMPLGAAFGQSATHTATLTAWAQGAHTYQQEYARAAAATQPLLLYFSNSRCRGCRANDFPQAPALQRLLAHVATVQIDPSHGPAARRLARDYQVTTTPALLLILPGTDLTPRRLYQRTAGKLADAVSNLYLSRVRQLIEQQRRIPARRAQQLATFYQRLVSPLTGRLAVR